MILFGASGHSKVIIDILEVNGIKVEKIFDDAPKHSEIFGRPIKKNSLLEGVLYSYPAIISIGNNKVRKEISEKYTLDYQIAIHPKSIVSKYSKIGAGTVVMAGAVINPNVEVGKHCIINTMAVVEHDCEIADFVHISPNVALAGNVKVGEGTHIGIGACVIQGVKIGRWCTIGAGAVVIRDIPDGVTVVGNPVREVSNKL